MTDLFHPGSEYCSYFLLVHQKTQVKLVTTNYLWRLSWWLPYATWWGDIQLVVAYWLYAESPMQYTLVRGCLARRRWWYIGSVDCITSTSHRCISAWHRRRAAVYDLAPIPATAHWSGSCGDVTQRKYTVFCPTQAETWQSSLAKTTLPSRVCEIWRAWCES